MEVIAAILAAMASLRRNVVMPFLVWRLAKMASEKGQIVEIDVERITAAVHIKFDGRGPAEPDTFGLAQRAEKRHRRQGIRKDQRKLPAPRSTIETGAEMRANGASRRRRRRRRPRN
jgi:hypothetical protein